jgi:hypothetical protein
MIGEKTGSDLRQHMDGFAISCAYVHVVHVQAHSWRSQLNRFTNAVYIRLECCFAVRFLSRLTILLANDAAFTPFTVTP